MLCYSVKLMGAQRSVHDGWYTLTVLKVFFIKLHKSKVQAQQSKVSTMGDIHRHCSKCVSSNCTNLGLKFEHSTLQCQRWLKDWQYVHTAHSAFHHSPQIKLKFEHSRVSTIGERLTVCAPGYLGWTRCLVSIPSHWFSLCFIPWCPVFDCSVWQSQPF